VIDRVPQLQTSAGHVKDRLKDQIIEHLAYAHAEGIDKPQIRNWQWPGENMEALAADVKS